MKLSTALKEKNKLTKKISETQKLINQHNSVIAGNPRPIDVKSKLTELDGYADKLVKLKSAIAVANQPINRHILSIAEIRSNIAFLRKLDAREGQVNERYGAGSATYDAEVKQSDILALIEKKESELEKLQEVIDQHNYNTTIDLEA